MHNRQAAAQGTHHSSASNMQQKAICHINGPARVLAGPGSGKTFTVIQRISYLTEHIHVPPEQILCITFTKAAALEMQERYQALMIHTAGNETDNVCFGTVHSICYHILKESGEFRQYSLIQESHKRKILEMLLVNKNLHDYNNYTMISELLYAFGRHKNGLPYREEDCLPIIQFEELYGEYVQALTERQLLDFDDMISGALHLLTCNDLLLKKWQTRFSYVIVDEFQDINQVQYDVIKLLSAPRNNLFVVGDDDQSIYGFRGALPDIMKQFKADFPDAADLYLTENFRSCEKVVTLADKIIIKNQNRISKQILPQKKGGTVTIYYEETGKEEESRILADISGLDDKTLMQSAVIVRTNSEANRYIRLLKAHRIPVKEQKIKQPASFNHFIQKDFEAFLRFCKEGYKRSDFLQIMNKPELFLSRQALAAEVVSLQELLYFYRENHEMQIKIRQLFHHLKKAESMSFSMAIRYFRNIIGYDTYLKARSNDSREYEEFLRIADELQLLCKKQKNAERCDAFWKRMEQENISLQENTTHTGAQEGICVLTMHGAKGLEFKQVFLPDVNEGVIPAKQCKSKESIEEERRLLYVAVTRAKDALFIYYTGERGRKPSRFIEGEKITKI